MDSSFLDKKSLVRPIEKILIRNIKKKYRKKRYKNKKLFFYKLKSVDRSRLVEGKTSRGLNGIVKNNFEADPTYSKNQLIPNFNTFSFKSEFNNYISDKLSLTLSPNNLQNNLLEDKNRIVQDHLVVRRNDDKENFLRKFDLTKKGLELDLDSVIFNKESKLLKIKENKNLLKSLKISKTTNVYKTVKKRNYLQIKPVENIKTEIMDSNDGTEYYISSRTNRKRKRIDYVSLDHGTPFMDELSESKGGILVGTKEEPEKKNPFEEVDVKINSTVNELPSNNDENNKSNEKKRRGRKKRTLENDNSSENVEKIITCGVCDLRMEFSSWSYHKMRIHNNLAWRDGELPLDLNDDSLVARILGELYKKRKPLYCDQCKISKKSVVGFLSHRSVCQKSVEEKEFLKIKCHHCYKKVLPVSMNAHLKFCGGFLANRELANRELVNHESVNHQNESNTSDEPVQIPQKNPAKTSKTFKKEEKKSTNDRSNTVTNKILTSLFSQINETDTVRKEEENVIKVKRGRGRQPRIETPVDNTTESDNIVECAICECKVQLIDWNFHKLRKHNNLAWKVGEEKIDLDDQNVVLRILNDIYRQRKPLHCEKCDAKKRSVMGYLSHKSVCQKSASEINNIKIECEYCHRLVLPVSMPSHLKYCRALDQNGDVKTDIEIKISQKRNAATKAQKFIANISQNEEENDAYFESETSSGNKEFVPPSKQLCSKTHHKNNFVRTTLATPNCFRIMPFKLQLREEGILTCKFDNCKYATQNVKEFIAHFASCDKRPQDGFFCKLCSKYFLLLDEVKEHVKIHDDSRRPSKQNQDDDKANSSESETDEIITYHISLLSLRNAGSVNFLKKALLTYHGSNKVVFPYAREWTAEFWDENYNLNNLFPTLKVEKSNWTPVSPILVSQYLPPLRYSCSVARKVVCSFKNSLKQSFNWKNYLLFESQLFDDGSSIFFCGGPVHALAWAPMPSTETDCNQYLAVVVSKEMSLNKGCVVGTGPGLIQIWNCGKLINNEIPKCKPELAFCIAHDYGNVMSLEWCPSGCFDSSDEENDSTKFKRLGLLAVGCSDSNIYIYSVRLPDLENQGNKVCKPKPSIKLQLVSPEYFAFKNEVVIPTKLSWAKSQGHRYLAAGYTNGVAAIFDLNSESTCLRVVDESDELPKLLPYQILQAHCFAITGICLYHLNSGRRWLATASLDRDCKFWDLDNPIKPFCSYQKFMLTDAVWFTHWLCVLTPPDDGGFNKLNQTCINLVGSFGANQFKVCRNLSRVNSVSANDWQSCFIQGSTIGEVNAIVHRHLLYSLDMDKRKKRQRNYPLSYIGLVDKLSTKIEESRSDDDKVEVKVKYEEMVDKYGMVFFDFDQAALMNNENLEAMEDEHGMTKPNHYPITSVNKCSFNQNCRSYHYYANGYQAGFVKLSYFNIIDR